MNDFSNLSAFDRCLVPLKAKESTAMLLSSSVEGLVSAKAKKEEMSVASDLIRRMSWPNTVISLMDKRYIYAPKTALGKRLSAIRERAIAQGLQLLTEDEIRNEVMLRRGEVL